MLTVKDNILVTTITFDFIRSSTTNDSPVTVPCNSFSDLELTTTDSLGDEREYRVRFKSQDGTMVDTYVVSGDTFNLLYKVFFKHNCNNDQVDLKKAITFHDQISDNDVTILKEDIASVSCVTYRNNEEICEINLEDETFKITKEDYYYFKKMVIGKKRCS